MLNLEPSQNLLAELTHTPLAKLQNVAHFRPLATALAMSEFVEEQLKKQPECALEWLHHPPQFNRNDYATQLNIALTEALAKAETEEDLARILRQFRHREMATLSYLQSNKLACVEEIFAHLSLLAESLILAARDWLFKECCQNYGTPMNELGEIQELLILGMGKLGGRELNFSSDIDLIFTYPDAGETVGARKPIENSKFFTRLGQKLIRALDQVTLDGFVYRTDMRLRPFGDNGALVLSFAAMEDYYQEQGRDWERYAMIKARILGEDPSNPNHRYLNQLLRPFVYRRYLDFSAIQSLREMKQKISREVVRRNLTDNIKLGAGGIREIEFIVQTFQMIRGGRDKSLRERSLLKVLAQLAQLNLISLEQVQQLQNAYLFLRQVENVLQAIRDEQTQTLPQNETDRQRLIFACQRFCQQGEWVNYPISDWTSFLTVLANHQANVRAVFSHLIGDEENEENELTGKLALWHDILNYQITLDETTSVLNEYAIPIEQHLAIFQLLHSTFQDWVKRPIGKRGRAMLAQLLPKLMDELAQRADFLTLLPRLLTIIDKITTRTTYLELLVENNQILPRLLHLCSQSVMIAEQIARYPMLLDELIHQTNLATVLALSDYPRALSDYLLRIPEDDEEQQIDALRQFKQSQILHIASADILGTLPVMQISDHLTYLAEAIIGAVVKMAWKQLTKRYGTPDHLAAGECDFVVIGYGKLGGIELGYNSDLDLVFLHQAPLNGETQGGKRNILSAQFYLKLAQKINGIFNLNTSAGVLYEVDMRLRPSGEAGWLVSSFDAFDSYQKNEAWTWENQALVRARCVFGRDDLRLKFEQIRQTTLRKSRASGQLRAEICKMREKMYQHLSHSKPDQFQLKTDQGGITDIEFIAQTLVLEYAHQMPKMAVWSDNVRILDSAVECGILSQSDGERLKTCYTTLRNRVHHLNLLRAESVVNADEFVSIRAFVAEMWHKVLGE